MIDAPVKQVRERYSRILQQVVLGPETDTIEVCLAEAFELGRSLVELGVAPDEVASLHHDTMVQFAQAHRSLSFVEVVERLARPLMEMSAAYGMAFREHMERRYVALVESRVAQSPRGAVVVDPMTKTGTRASGLSNDFNNLLASIVGFAEMAGDDLPEGSAGRSNLQSMIDNLKTLLSTEQVMLEEIAVNERRFRSWVENSPDIIMRYDRECECLFVNPAFSRENGLVTAQVLNRRVGDAPAWCFSVSREEYLSRLQQVMATGLPDHIPLDWQRQDGQWVHHEFYVVAESGANGQNIGVLVIGRDVTQRKVAEQKLQRQASYDGLTGLPNRNFFGEQLRGAIVSAERDGYGLAVLFVDLDRFKEVNDTLGHGAGDRLLVDAAQRIRSCMRACDTVARLAGDEFVVLLAGDGLVPPAESVAQRIIDAMAAPFYLGEQDASISASVGIAVYPRDADSAESLIACADQAMYAAKESGRNNFSFFTADMLERARYRALLRQELRGALAKGQLAVYYQPIVDVFTGRATKAEALLRWRHPELGMVPPDQFIPIAEENDLIHVIGEWVLCEAADTARRWNALAGQQGLRQISVNMSPRQFTRGNSGQQAVENMLARTPNTAHIAIEITEGLLLDDSSVVRKKLEQLRWGGFEISLDDFGTGYSAMSYLKKFNIDYLKIDRSFVSDLETDSDGRAIAEAIVMMAHRLGIKVIAEGVETQGQFDLLAAVGCEYVQGYLFARPMPVEEFMVFVDSFQVAAEANSCALGALG